MESVPPRFEAMTSGALLDRMFRLYGENFTLLLGIVAVSYAPIFGLQLVAQAVGLSLKGFAGPLIMALASFGVLLLILLVAYPLAEGAATYAISQRYLGRSVTIGQAYRRSCARWGTLLNAQVSVGLRVLGGTLLLIVPGILCALSYMTTIPAVMLEGGKARVSMKRSWELTQGGRGKVLGVMIVAGVLQWIPGLAVMLLLGLVVDRQSAAGQLLVQVLGNLASLVVLPLGVIGPLLLYYDFRIRKEGFDLEMLGQALSEPTPPAAAPPPPVLSAG